MNWKKEYTIQEYNILYVNTLCYLRHWEKKFIFLFCVTQNRSQKEAYQYLVIIRKFIKNYDLSIENVLKKKGFYINWKIANRKEFDLSK
jgi:hypothetical protein